MPKNPSIKKVLVIGSGPIVIGQAAEFDYAGTQACRALREEGIEVVLVNSNPATIMTDKEIADEIYIEPLLPETIKKVIEKEKPDSVLPTLGGQTGLNLAMTLAEEGYFEKAGVRLLGANPETIKKAEDREAFKETMEKLGEPSIPSDIANDMERALEIAEEIGLPVIIRPAYTLGGTGGGIAWTKEELLEILKTGFLSSPIHQVLVEKCISGWKEIEYEVMRDGAGNVIAICNMENIDPVGVHTGDSIVIAPTQTLTDREHQMLRTSALNIITELSIEGGCNVQFALNPESFEYAVIEVNPRVSRSSALASKATGYPIAKMAAKIAIGYTLSELKNAVTKTTSACFEPALDYCVIKFPRFPFDKFVYAQKTLGTQMKSTGEVMAIADSFELAMMKAVISSELKLETMSLPALKEKSDNEIRALLPVMDHERIFVVYEAVKREISLDEIFLETRIDKWFLSKLKNLARMERRLSEGNLCEEVFLEARRMGFLSRTIERLSGEKIKAPAPASYRMVDTCAAEFEAETPYFYSGFDGENEAKSFIERRRSREKKKILVFGSGPIRIGQGIEFDYCSVHCVWALQRAGYEAIIANNNPETVSTDFDTGDRLYFDPLDYEYVHEIIKTENPDGVVVSFGGQTAIALARHMERLGVQILGTSAEDIDRAENREEFDLVLEKCGIPRPEGKTVMTAEGALEAAEALGYPVLLRPSYVLGGQNMIIAHDDGDVKEYMAIITAGGLESPVLIDKYLMGIEAEVDAVSDGEEILIPGIMEHIERAGVHSGDSISVYPPRRLSKKIQSTMVEYTRLLAKELRAVGMINIQYVVYNDTVYVIEVNPRSSRTVPYVSKVTGVPVIDLATRCMLGGKLKDMGYGAGLYKESEYWAVKVPVFSFEKLKDLDTQLGPEMKSTGEVLGLSRDYGEAVLKGLIASGGRMKTTGGVLITVADGDKQQAVEIAEKFEKLGFTLYATGGTARMLNLHMLPTNAVRKVREPEPNILSLIESGEISYVISTSGRGRNPLSDGVRIRRKAVERRVMCLTSLDTASVVADCLSMQKGIGELGILDITKL